LPLITALGVREALAVFSPPEVGIKWPNDVLCAAGKLGGILVEGTQEAYVVGVGVNVNRPDEGAFEGAAYLNDMCADSKEALSDVNNQGFRSTQTLELEPVVAALINNILARFKLWGERGYDFTQFATEYRRHLLLIGEEVTLRTALGQEIATGTIEGVNDKGQLLLATQSGQTAVAVGEVTLRNPMER
jgi:BirA family biotin operon repressor/biotin-[acetyl-CoA-carboxylase] ligase